MPGRKAKPGSVKEAEGNRGHRPIVNNEGKLSGVISDEPPEWMSPAGAEFWRRYAPQLRAAGLSKSLYEPKFEVLCATYAKWREDTGDYKLTGPLRGMMSEFGMDPSSVGKVTFDTANDKSGMGRLLRAV